MGAIGLRNTREGGSMLLTRTAIDAALRRLAPRVPAHERGSIVDHALDNAALRSATLETAAWLSLVAYVRHALTDYDALLGEGYDQESSRFFVAAAMYEILRDCGVRRPLATKD